MSKFQGLGVAVDAPARMTIMHPISNQPLRHAETKEEAWIDLLSASSKPGKEHDRLMLDRAIKRGNRRATAEQIEADSIEKLAKLTKAWTLLTLNGAQLDVECNIANARELYSMPEMSWLYDQVNVFVADLGNFRPAASTS